MLKYLVVATISVSACKGGSGGKLEPKAIGDSGFVVDAPSSWTVKADMKDFYTVTAESHNDGWVQIIVSDRSGATSLDDFVKSASCTDPGKVVKEKSAAGTLFVQCEAVGGEIDGKPLKVQRIVAEATDGTHHASCHIDTDQNVATVAAVCKSLRKK